MCSSVVPALALTTNQKEPEHVLTVNNVSTADSTAGPMLCGAIR